MRISELLVYLGFSALGTIAAYLFVRADSMNEWELTGWGLLFVAVSCFIAWMAAKVHRADQQDGE